MTDSENSSLAASVARRYGHVLRRFLSVRLRNNLQDVPDLVQEVYLRVLRARHLKAVRNLEAYLITMANHVAYEYAVSKGANTPIFKVNISDLDITQEMWQLVAPVGEDPAVRAENAERVDRFQKKILARLPPRAGAALVLHRIYGYSVQETADQMGLTRETVKKYLADAVQRFGKTGYGDARDA